MNDLATSHSENNSLDLAANETQLDPQTARERAAIALQLGYDGIAFVAQAGETLTAGDK